MGTRNDFLDFVKDDDRRRQDDSKIQTLQAQIDEVRQTMREMASRAHRLEEQVKAAESSAAQDRIGLEHHRHEASQAAQARQIEEARVRQQIAELSTRIDDSTRPIRTIQAHVSELIETVRRQRDDGGDDDKRFDELQSSIDYLNAHYERQVVVSQSLRDSTESLQTELDRLQRQIYQTDDSVKIVEHEARRRVTEVAQEIENFGSRLDDQQGLWDSVYSNIDDLRERLLTVDPRFDAVHKNLESIEDDIKRFEVQTRERDNIQVERTEEIRQYFEDQLQDIRDRAEERHERLEHRIDSVDQIDRELSYRINMLEMTLEDLRQADDRLRRDLWYLHEQRVRLRVEQAQEELERVREARRDAERRASRGEDVDEQGEG